MEPVSFGEFLAKVPPGKNSEITDLTRKNEHGALYLHVPDLQLHCDECDGPRIFESDTGPSYVTYNAVKDLFLVYYCRNCRTGKKTYAIRIAGRADTECWGGFKFGEYPGFGPPVPARVITLIGPDREMFLKGRRSENQGLGIGAYAYYRRVVENQKNRIFDEIIRVTNRIAPDPDLIADLENAKKESQFSKALDAIKHGLPQGLMINGHNPLALLHSALSEGVHDLTDEECLTLATSARVVLFELAERLGQLLKDQAELDKAVTQLFQKRAKPPADPSPG